MLLFTSERVPHSFFDGWMQVAFEEAKHFTLLRNRLRTLEQHVNASDLPDDVSPDERDVVWNDLKEIISRISDAGKNVVYVMQAPEVSRRVEDLIYRFGKHSRNIVGLEREWWDRVPAPDQGRG